VSNQRADTLQQVTTRLAKTTAVLVIEDLSVAGLLKHHHLAQALADGEFAEFRRHLLYKAAWYGSRVVLAARWEPSSKTCSACGWYDADLELADRMFRCQNAECGQILDRDLNAAINLSTLAGSSPESENACGGASAGWGREAPVHLTAVKQEPNTFCASA
jgi:putative transposase